jgi:carboxyl-terminal processing protease
MNVLTKNRLASSLIVLMAVSLPLSAQQQKTPEAQAKVDAETYRQLDTLMDVFERVRAEYVDQVDDRKLIEGAINGMVSSLDPHSGYLDAREKENMRVSIEGEYGGLGLEVTWDEGVVKIVAPIDDTPGFRAGIKSGDYITHINKQAVFGSDLQASVDKMRGPVKTPVTLTIVRRDGDKLGKPFDVTIVRDVIQQAPVKSDVKPGGIVYIRVPQFNLKAAGGVRAAIEKNQNAGIVNGYVLDLRSNPGGALDQALEMSDLFLERGEIVSQRPRRKSEIRRYFARPGDLTAGKPVVVLINEGSASASEIVAGALQDNRRGVVVGRRSFGKGSVQTLININEDAQLRLTTARYFTPSGRSVQEQGIEPDIDVLQLSAGQKATDRPNLLTEAELGGHLVNAKKEADHSEEKDAKGDPRQVATPEQLKAQGVEDYQLDYALKLIRRVAPDAVVKAKA